MATVSVTHLKQSSRHQANIESSLAHRLQVARAADNFQLVRLLEQEKQQVQVSATYRIQPSLLDRLKTLWQGIVDVITGNAQLQVWRTSDAVGLFWWHAYDPRTGRSVSTDSETELRLWIEKNYSEI